MRRTIALAAVAVPTALGLSGCMWLSGGGGSVDTGSGGLLLDGTVEGWPISGPARLVLAWAGSPSTDCGRWSGALTIVDGAGDELREQLSGLACSPGPAAVEFAGDYTVTGGTGRFAGATGGGTVRFTVQIPFRSAGAWTAVQAGVLHVPGLASASTVRTTRLRGTVSRVRVCERPRHRRPRCRPVRSGS
jgi:hypothetical protein